jgi:carnosine N-methyltransferase
VAFGLISVRKSWQLSVYDHFIDIELFTQGPLLWHFENTSGSDVISIELNLEEVKALCKKIGFEIENEKTLKTTYASVPDGMLNYVYDAAFWTATKI